jgi:hypothetical protein
MFTLSIEFQVLKGEHINKAYASKNKKGRAKR